MKRRIQGLHEADRSAPDEVPDGLFLVRVERAQYRWHAQKPYYILLFSILEPKQMAGRSITCRVYCTPKALWKLSWFLRDFGFTIPNCSDEMRSTSGPWSHSEGWSRSVTPSCMVLPCSTLRDSPQPVSG